MIVDGYQIVSDEGVRTPQPDFMDNHLAANGYARV
jgi:hypothetical protein